MHDENPGHSSGGPPPGAQVLAPGVWIAADGLRFTFTRSSGPGGQSVNKLSTRAQLRVSVTDIVGLDDSALTRLRRLAGQRLTTEDEIVIQAQTYRSQLDNRRACVERLAELVARAARPPKKRRRTRPSRAMIERRLAAKKERSDKKSRRRWRPGEG
jgi:ribosome-associated protein